MDSKFKQLREKAGLSSRDAADLLGYKLKTIYRWDHGEIIPKKPVFDELTRMVNAAQITTPRTNNQFTFIDLFAGIGGLRVAFEGVGGKCVYTSEWNKFSRQTYCANFHIDHDIDGDITKVHEEDVPNHNLLVAGFPCQPFSLAGVSKKNSLGRAHGFLDETQGTLFFDIVRILKHHRPEAILLENVKNLVSHDKGKTFKVIKRTLQEIGYHIDHRIIDAKSFLPQHRERIFIAGFRDDIGFNFMDLKIPPPSAGPVLSAVLHPEDGTELADPPYTIGELATVNPKYTLTDNLWRYLKEYAEKHKKRGNGFGYGLVGPEDVSRTISARYHKDGSEILIRQVGGNPRRLTPRECSRLMGFDGFGESNFVIPVSDTQAYRQFGNAVAVPVVKAIAEYMAPRITGEDKSQQTGQLRLC